MNLAQDLAVCDLAIVGAGPAGMAAALQASDLGLSVTVLDEQPAPGGQIWRNVAAAAEGPAAGALGRSFLAGRETVERFQDSGADYRGGAMVWHVEAEPGQPCRLWLLRGGQVAQVRAHRVLLASGAQERPVPVPGWTLPGVMTVGALQILLKTAAMTPKEPAVLVGSGPLLYLTAAQHVAAGGTIASVLLTRDPGGLRSSLRHLPGFLASGLWRAGASLLRDFRRLGVPVVRDVASVEIEGEDRVRRVVYRTGAGERGALEASLVALHEGVIPASNLARAIGCEEVWDETQLGFRPRVDAWGQSSIEAVQIAGDCAGIAGADAALLSGRLAALEAARALGRIGLEERDRLARPLRRAQARILRGRAFIDTLYAPRLARGRIGDDIVICRCEAVTAGAVRAAVAGGAKGPNQIKAFLRCGMGPCQGRFCAATVTRLIAEAREVPEAEVGQFRLRPPVKPVPLRAFAAAGEEV